jgi:hypothetical protein
MQKQSQKFIQEQIARNFASATGVIKTSGNPRVGSNNFVVGGYKSVIYERDL